MNELVFLLEEESARIMLEAILPKLIPKEVNVRYITFEGKQDLEKQIVKKLLAYRNKNARFIIMRDQDSHPDCKEVKKKLAHLCEQAGHPDSLIRIVCRELESFYLADLSAVESGLGLRGLAKRQEQSKFRNPDRIGSPSVELDKLTNGNYQKVGGSRTIAPFLDLENARSASFRNLITGIRRIADTFD